MALSVSMPPPANQYHDAHGIMTYTKWIGLQILILKITNKYNLLCTISKKRNKNKMLTLTAAVVLVVRKSIFVSLWIEPNVAVSRKN